MHRGNNRWIGEIMYDHDQGRIKAEMDISINANPTITIYPYKMMRFGTLYDGRFEVDVYL